MSELEHVSEQAVEKEEHHGRLLEWPVKQLGKEFFNYCAYNQSRGRFLGTDVELVDLSPEYLREHLAGLTAGSEMALWLVPFRGISPNHVDTPIDLIFLDRNNSVLAVVESYPISHPDTSNWPSPTALALPAQTVASTGTLAGDQLILCSLQKMRSRLRNLESSADSVPEAGVITTGLENIEQDLPPIRKTSVESSSWEEVLHQQRHKSKTPELPPIIADPVAEPSNTIEVPPSDKKNWLLCLFTPNRREARKSDREYLPWVAAYFFNGGVPAPASVRNISQNGMYVFTSERWYLGTIVRVTLTDWRLPSPERSLTINAVAVRWGEDGVGLKFIFDKANKGRRGASTIEDGAMATCTREQLREFLQQFKDAAPPQRWQQRIFRAKKSAK